MDEMYGLELLKWYENEMKSFQHTIYCVKKMYQMQITLHFIQKFYKGN